MTTTVIIVSVVIVLLLTATKQPANKGRAQFTNEEEKAIYDYISEQADDMSKLELVKALRNEFNLSLKDAKFFAEKARERNGGSR